MKSCRHKEEGSTAHFKWPGEQPIPYVCLPRLFFPTSHLLLVQALLSFTELEFSQKLKSSAKLNERWTLVLRPETSVSTGHGKSKEEWSVI